MIIHAKDDSISRTNFDSFPEGASLMEIMGYFKQHLEDIVETLEIYREKSDYFKENDEVTKNLQNEQKMLFAKIQELEVENEKLKFELSNNLHESMREFSAPKYGEAIRLKEELEKLKNLTQEQRDMINNYEELLKEEKKDKNNFKIQLNERSDSMKKKLKEKNKRFKYIQNDLFKLQSDFRLIKDDRDELIKHVKDKKTEIQNLRYELEEVLEENSDLKSRMMNIEGELDTMTERYLNKDSRMDALTLKVSDQENLICSYEKEINGLKEMMKKEKKKGRVYFEPKYSDFKSSQSKYCNKSFSGSIIESFADKKKSFGISVDDSQNFGKLRKRIRKLEKEFKATGKLRKRHRRSSSISRKDKRLKTKKIMFNENKENNKNIGNFETPSTENVGNMVRNLSREMTRFDRKITKIKKYF